jgi:hypothetical protein
MRQKNPEFCSRGLQSLQPFSMKKLQKKNKAQRQQEREDRLRKADQRALDGEYGTGRDQTSAFRGHFSSLRRKGMGR